MAIEKIHHGLYSEALKTLRSGKDLPAARIFVCPVCGNTIKDNVPDKCPICNTPKDKFMEI